MVTMQRRDACDDVTTMDACPPVDGARGCLSRRRRPGSPKMPRGPRDPSLGARAARNRRVMETVSSSSRGKPTRAS